MFSSVKKGAAAHSRLHGEGAALHNDHEAAIITQN